MLVCVRSIGGRYSAGGLVARAAIAQLHAEGLFKRLDPRSFVTVATPHLGMRPFGIGPASAGAVLLRPLANMLGGRTVLEILQLDEQVWVRASIDGG